MNERYKDFPPGWGHLRIPTSSKSAALAGLTMYAPCKRAAVWAHRAAWAAVSVFGPSTLIGKAHLWDPPVERELWITLLAVWRAELSDFDTMAVYQRLQTERPGLMLLLINSGKPVAFVKLRKEDGSGLRTEEVASTAAFNFRPRSFTVPRPLLLGELSGWHYLATTPHFPRPHRVPENPALGLIVSEIETALGELPRPPNTPHHWKPMHGDLTPWNLRQAGRREVALVDWEEAAWAPPGADEVMYRATAAAVHGELPGPSGPYDEAIEFWQRHIDDRPVVAQRDQRLAASLRRALNSMYASRN